VETERAFVHTFRFLQIDRGLKAESKRLLKSLQSPVFFDAKDLLDALRLHR
jgi:hypothetical protein